MGRGKSTRYNAPVQPYKQLTIQAVADLECNHLYNILDEGKEKTIATIDFKPARYNVGDNMIDASCTLLLTHMYQFCEDGFYQGRHNVANWFF